MAPSISGEDVDHFVSHVQLEKRVSGIEEKQKGINKLSFEVRALTNEVQRLGLVVGSARHVSVPADWEEITQVKRPELQSLRVRARRGPPAAGAAVGIVWALVELLRAIADGRIHWPWH